MKETKLCSCLCSSSLSSSRFSASCVQNFGKLVFLILKTLRRVDQSIELTFSEYIHVGIDIRIDISISTKPINTKSDK